MMRKGTNESFNYQINVIPDPGIFQAQAQAQEAGGRETRGTKLATCLNGRRVSSTRKGVGWSFLVKGKCSREDSSTFLKIDLGRVLIMVKLVVDVTD